MSLVEAALSIAGDEVEVAAKGIVDLDHKHEAACDLHLARCETWPRVDAADQDVTESRLERPVRERPDRASHLRAVRQLLLLDAVEDPPARGVCQGGHVLGGFSLGVAAGETQLALEFETNGLREFVALERLQRFLIDLIEMEVEQGRILPLEAHLDGNLRASSLESRSRTAGA